MEVLDEATWRTRSEAHAARVDALVGPHLARRARGEKHPVHDFMFTYYSFRPAQLRRWYPGIGVRLEGVECATGTIGHMPAHSIAQQVHHLLVATAGRAGNFGCFGLHEWAMVHRASSTRHAWPLRLGSTATDEVVESHRIACSHFDAFRFFTPSARPLNTLQPGRDDRAAFEQPACLHGNMDLYGKVAVRLSPLIPSELVADAFELAWDIRIMDMRAAPYDFTGLILDPSGEEWTPVKIETPEGKQEYVQAQRDFMERAAPIRRELIDWCERLLSVE